MILQLKIKNYRSYKEETTFSLEANSSDQKLENVFDLKNEKQEFRILKSAIIYGANASGKSNVIRAFYEILNLILNKPKVDEELRIYEPFLFNNIQSSQPCEFELTFIGPNNYKYIYKIVILKGIILNEDLSYQPNGRITKLFSRESYNNSNRIQKGILGDTIGKKEISVFANQLILSKFGDDEPHELLTEIFLYFNSYEIINATNNEHKVALNKMVSEDFYNNKDLQLKLAKLIKAADTKVNEIQIVKSPEDLGIKGNLTGSTYKNPFSIYGLHEMYSGEDFVGTKNLPFHKESIGTQSLFTLGGKILRTIENGGILIVDELDTSLHPFITKMIVMIFQSSTINNKNAQLIFTTHDVSLLDRDLIRRDQVWIAEKNKKGETNLYSLQDFEGLREDTPFEKWYLAGKFGGLPQIKSIESLFE